MSIMEFTYTKSPTDISNRVYYPLVSPTDKYFGIDLSDLDIEDQLLVEEALLTATQEYKEQVDLIMQKHDIKHMYRSFMPSKMTNIVVEE